MLDSRMHRMHNSSRRAAFLLEHVHQIIVSEYLTDVGVQWAKSDDD